MIDNATRDFKERLMQRRATPVRHKTNSRASLSEILDLLKKIQMMLMNEKPGSASAVNFIVTERDEKGKIRSFKVES